MAQDTYARLVGVPVALEGETGPFRACPYCSSHTGRVAEGTGPHIAAVECQVCDRHLAWLSRDHLAAMAAKAWGDEPKEGAA